MGSLATNNKFTSLIRWLDAFFADKPAYAAYGDLALALRATGASSWSSWLSDAVAAWEPGTAGSSAHELIGFTKVSLYDSHEYGYQMRLHIWWNGRRTHDAFIHEHRWALASTVIAGELRILNFDRVSVDSSDAVRLVSHHLSDGDADGRKSICVEGEVGLTRTSDYILGTNGCHSLNSTEAHQVFNWSEGVSSTLLVTGPPVRGYSVSYRPQVASDGHTSEREPWDRVAISAAVERLRPFLEQPHLAACSSAVNPHLL